jgi:hypothetical protein
LPGRGRHYIVDSLADILLFLTPLRLQMAVGKTVRCDRRTLLIVGAGILGAASASFCLRRMPPSRHHGTQLWHGGAFGAAARQSAGSPKRPVRLPPPRRAAVARTTIPPCKRPNSARRGCLDLPRACRASAATTRQHCRLQVSLAVARRGFPPVELFAGDLLSLWRWDTRRASGAR